MDCFMNVAIVKYNAGNIYSVVNALRRLGVEPLLTDDAEQLQKADRVLFPGQGEARGAMEYLKARRLDEVIKNLKQPVFGICVGQQLLCKHSEEGDVDCIGIFDAEVKRFSPTRHEDKVPCMGWNALDVRWKKEDGREIGDVKCSIFEGLGDNPYVYFVHSYYVPLCEDTAAIADYIQPYSAALQKDNFYACQFHPEKSSTVGLKILSIMIELIPAIDIIEGQCVRLTKGDYDQKTVYGNPLEMAQEFERIGFRRLHMVDLDGAKSKHIVNDEVLNRITKATNLIVDFGGGIKTDEDIRKAFDNGASMVTVGSIAVTQPELFLSWVEQYGAERLILGADVRNGKISINGWKEDSTEDLLPFLRRYIDAGVRNVLCTEISKDGTLQGPAIELYQRVMKEYLKLHLIASGGVSSIEDIKSLDAAGIPAVVFGKAIYEGKINLQELWDWQNA